MGCGRWEMFLEMVNINYVLKDRLVDILSNAIGNNRQDWTNCVRRGQEFGFAASKKKSKQDAVAVKFL